MAHSPIGQSSGPSISGEPPIYLVRHAKAGAREQWAGDDRLRPLSGKGKRQAEELVTTFRGMEVNGITSSPYVRCTQSVGPLALDRGLVVEVSDALAEGAAVSAAIELLGRVPPGTMLCSHGDVISATVSTLAESGMTIEGSDELKKGSTWMLDRSLGRFVRARYLPPPAIG